MRHGRTFRSLRSTLDAFNDSGRVSALAFGGHPLALCDNPAGTTTPPATPPARSRSRTDDDDDDEPTSEGKRTAAKLIAKFRGRAEDALADVLDENKELRIQRRELRGQVPKEGERVLSAADATAFDAYKALGTPEVLKTTVAEHAERGAKLDDLGRLSVADTAAPLLGWNPTALRTLVADKKLELSFKDETVDSKTVKVPYVKVAGDKAEPVKLADYAKTSLAVYLPSLTAKPEAPKPDAGTGRTGTQYPEQTRATDTGGNATNTPAPRPVAGARQYLRPSDFSGTGNGAASNAGTATK